MRFLFSRAGARLRLASYDRQGFALFCRVEPCGWPSRGGASRQQCEYFEPRASGDCHLSIHLNFSTSSFKYTILISSAWRGLRGYSDRGQNRALITSSPSCVLYRAYHLFLNHHPAGTNSIAAVVVSTSMPEANLESSRASSLRVQINVPKSNTVANIAHILSFIQFLIRSIFIA